MKLDKKKSLAIRTLGIGKKRIVFVKSRLDEVKEAITKQDIKDLVKEGAIIIKEIKGKRKVEKRKRQTGKIKKKVKKRKKEYIIMTRKLRKYILELKKKNKLSREDFLEIRKKIRNKYYRSLAHLKESIWGKKKWEL